MSERAQRAIFLGFELFGTEISKLSLVCRGFVPVSVSCGPGLGQQLEQMLKLTARATVGKTCSTNS